MYALYSNKNIQRDMKIFLKLPQDINQSIKGHYLKLYILFNKDMRVSVCVLGKDKLLKT